MKKIIACAAALALALAMAGCVGQSSHSAKSAMSASDTSTSQTSASASSSASVSWTDAKTADEAAKGAGLAKFGAPDSTVIADIKFENPKFGYTEGAAQAVYEPGASMLTVRKSDASHTKVLSDKDVSTYAANWTKTYENIEVTCYGPARGASEFITWADGDNHYGVWILGLGGDELSMDEEDVDDIVKAVKAANADTAAAASGSSASAGSGYIGEDAAINAAVASLKLGLPENASAQLITGGDAPHYEVTLTWGTEKHIVTLDAYTGQIWDNGYNNNNNSQQLISEDDAKKAAIDAAAVGIPDSVEVSLVNGSVPYYAVTMTKNGDTITIDVNGYTGQAM